HLHTVYTQHEQYQEIFPVTNALSQSMISIPVHHGLYDNEVEKIVIALSNL
ncbi:MAG: DegT/DnrJ/EryC1/StrS family aminotransferase, partial [Candidatus Poseidoniaceae archaeon]